MNEREQGGPRDRQQPREPAGPGTPHDPATVGRFKIEASGSSPARFAGAGFMLLVMILGGLYLGKWMDAKLGTAPWLMIVGVFFGAGSGFYSLYRQLTAAQTAEDRETARRRDERGGL